MPGSPQESADAVRRRLASPAELPERGQAVRGGGRMSNEHGRTIDIDGRREGDAGSTIVRRAGELDGANRSSREPSAMFTSSRAWPMNR